MRTVNVHEAKTTLSQLLVEIERGEQITISRAGTPVAKLVSIQADSHPAKRKLDILQGYISVPDDFDCWASADISDLFEGSDEPLHTTPEHP